MEKLYYTVGELAEMLGEPTSVIRFWANTFEKYIKPKRNAKGNRLFREKDVDAMKQVYLLVRKEGMTLKGVEIKLAGERSTIARKAKAMERLMELRRQLDDIRNRMSK